MSQTVQVDKLYNFLNQILEPDTSRCRRKTASDWIAFGQSVPQSRTYNLDWGIFSLIEFIGSNSEEIGKKFKTCIDIGSGYGVQTDILRHAGLDVFQLDKYCPSAEYQVDFLEYIFDQKFDVVFCSHVIEHQRNVGNFLDKIYDILSDEGVLILSAPKHEADTMIEGHLNCFKTPYFIQHLLHAGFNLKDGKYLSCGKIENAAIVFKDLNFNLEDRELDGHNWTDRHQETSFITLENKSFKGMDLFFHNCEVLRTDSAKGITMEFPEGYEQKGINMNAPRWNLDITF
jgi:SAM-dependent methyltransferase